MKLSIEITMYPLEDKYLPIIENFIEDLILQQNIYFQDQCNNDQHYHHLSHSSFHLKQ